MEFRTKVIIGIVILFLIYTLVVSLLYDKVLKEKNPTAGFISLSFATLSVISLVFAYEEDIVPKGKGLHSGTSSMDPALTPKAMWIFLIWFCLIASIGCLIYALIA